MTLPANVTRCHDAGCRERNECRRWLERDAGRQHNHSMRPLNPFHAPICGRCPEKISLTESVDG